MFIISSLYTVEKKYSTNPSTDIFIEQDHVHKYSSLDNIVNWTERIKKAFFLKTPLFQSISNVHVENVSFPFIKSITTTNNLKYFVYKANQM